MKHKILDKKFISNSTLQLDLSRENLEFTPGSCVSLKLDNISRPYSIASGVNEPFLRFYIRIFNDGKMTQKLINLKQDDDIEITEKFSYFTPGDTNGQYCYIATGTGISPFLSALKSLDSHPHTIFYGARYKEELLELSFLRRYNILYTLSKSDDNFTLKGRITDYLSYIPLSPKINEIGGMTYYICGIDQMINDVSTYLIDNGIHFSQIQQEQFYQKQL